MAERWRVEVRDGLHRGAVAELAPGALLLLGADAQCDVVLADDGVAARHLSLLVQAQALELRAFDAALLVTQGGASIELAPGARQALRADAEIGLPGSAVRLALLCAPQAQPSSCAPGGVNAAVPREGAARPSPPARSPRRSQRWLLHGATAAAVLVLVSGALAAVVLRAATGPALSRDALQALIAQRGLQTAVRIVEDGPALSLRGVVAVAALNTLQQELSQRRWPVALQLQTPEQLLAAAESVFRTNGVSAAWTYLGDGRLQAAQVDPADPQVRKLAEVVKRDVAGLTELRFAAFDGARPTARTPLTDPGKRLTAIVSGATPYVATADNSRYLVGSTLPDGHLVRAIGDEGVQLERNGTTTWLRLD